MTPNDSNDIISIVIADDHSVAREGLISMLGRQAEFRVVGEASNGKEAFDLCESLLPDVLVLDMRMPIMDGVATVEALQRARNPVRAVVMTTYDGDEDVRRVLKAGAKGYLLKDATRQVLWETIRRVHAGESVIAASVMKSVTDALSNPVLTQRQLEVLTLMGFGLSNKEIANRLFISEATIKTHVNSILSKLDAGGRTEAVVIATRRGLVQISK